MPNTESATQAGVYNYSGTTTNFTPGAQVFTLATRRTVTTGTNPWDAGTIFFNTGTIAYGDACVVLIWLRSETVGAKLNFYAENSTTYDKQVFSTVNVGNTWKLYAAPFEATAPFAANTLNLGLHLAYKNQVIEYGGMACINYQNKANFDQLPVLLNNDYYPGMEPDAPWRLAANNSIEQIRKANLTVQVQGANGQIIPGAQVKVEMLQHAFKFGTAVVSNKFNGGSDQNATYEAKLLDLDGNGHGFNEVVFENDLKWPAWEQSWLSSKPELQSDVQWLKNHGITIRGHNLVWPSWGYSPPDIDASITPAYLKQRIRGHLKSILGYPGIGTEMEDWDVLNEITANVEFADFLAGKNGYVTGRELYTEIFKQADSLAPNAKLYLNDYVAIEQGDATNNGIATWKSRLDELIAAGAPLEGIGFQGHFGASPTGIARVKEIYDDFWNTYGLEAKVTEYDIDKLVPQQTQANYLRDFLTISFAHPSLKGFLMWGFWDGAHWLGNAPLYSEDWTLKPSGQAFVDLVFHQWWTKENGLTNNLGNYTVRGFKGKYRVTVTCADGSTQTKDVLLENNLDLVFLSNCTVAANEPGTNNWNLQISPTLVYDAFQVRWNGQDASSDLQIQCMDATGKILQSAIVPEALGYWQQSVALWPAGTYFVTVSGKNGQKTIQLAVEK